MPRPSQAVPEPGNPDASLSPNRIADGVGTPIVERHAYVARETYADIDSRPHASSADEPSGYTNGSSTAGPDRTTSTPSPPVDSDRRRIGGNPDVFRRPRPPRGLDFPRPCRDTGRGRGISSGQYGGRQSSNTQCVVPRSLSCQPDPRKSNRLTPDTVARGHALTRATMMLISGKRAK